MWQRTPYLILVVTIRRTTRPRHSTSIPEHSSRDRETVAEGLPEEGTFYGLCFAASVADEYTTISFPSRFKFHQEARRISYRAPTTGSVDWSGKMKWHVAIPGFWLRWFPTPWMAEYADLQGSGLSCGTCRIRSIRAYKATYTACSSSATHSRIVLLLSKAATSLEKSFLPFNRFL